MNAIESKTQDLSFLMIPVTMAQFGTNQESPVSARELHAFLRVDKDFSDWIKSQIQRAGLQEHRDYECSPFRGNQTGRGGDRRSIEYTLTPRAAKHVALMSKTKKGREVRDYFIECERRLMVQALPSRVPGTLAKALRLAADQSDRNATKLATIAVHERKIPMIGPTNNHERRVSNLACGTSENVSGKP